MCFISIVKLCKYLFLFFTVIYADICLETRRCILKSYTIKFKECKPSDVKSNLFYIGIYNILYSNVY